MFLKTKPTKPGKEMVNLIGKLKYPALKIFLQNILNILFSLIFSPGKLGHNWAFAPIKDFTAFFNFYDIYTRIYIYICTRSPIQILVFVQ